MYEKQKTELKRNVKPFETSLKVENSRPNFNFLIFEVKFKDSSVDMFA